MPWLKQKSFEEICSPLLARAEHHDRFAELDGLRGIAAIWVMLFHFTKGLTLFWLSNNLTLANEITPLSINIRGTSAVELFFIISGYVIFMTLRRCRNLSDFFASRFARLFPAYWVAVAVSTIVGMLLPAANLPVNIMQAIGNLTMLQAYLGIPGVDPSYWSLAFELAFYVLMGVVFHFRLLGRIEQLGFAWLVLSCIAVKLLPLTGLAIPWRLSTAMILPYTGLFFAGIIFYKIREEGFTWPRAALILLCWMEQLPPIRDTVGCIILTSIFAIFAFSLTGRLSVLRCRPLVFLGTISYSLYLIHQPLGFRIQLGLHAIGASPETNLALSVLIIITIASVITYTIEKPATLAIRAWFKRNKF